MKASLMNLDFVETLIGCIFYNKNKEIKFFVVFL